MATKGGSLLGKADSTLVQGALKAELANISPNMQGIYQMQAENVTNLQTAVQDFFYAFDKSNLDLQNEVKELTPKLLADIETGTYIDDSYVDLVSQEINSLRQQMKSIPRGREGEAERAKIRARLANIKAESGSAEQTMTKIATLIDNGQVDLNSLQNYDMELWKSILDKSAKREFVDGKLVYTANINGKELKINHSDLEKRFLPKQYGVQSNALKLSNGFINVGKQGLDYDFNSAMNAYEALMTNKQEVLGLINNPFGSMQYSFKDALKGKDPKLVGELLGALNRIGGFNVEGDERPDQITMSNLNKLVSTLTNPDDDNFNLATTKRVAAAFYADNDGRIQHKKGKDLYDAKKDSSGSDEKGWLGSGDSLAMFGGNRYLDYNIALDMYDSFKSAKDGKETNFNIFNTKYDYDPKTNEWSTGEGDDKNVFGDSDQFRKSLGISAPEFKELTKGSTVITEDDDINELINKNETGDIAFTSKTFQQSDDTFIEQLENTYDMSDYIVDVYRDPIFGADDLINSITIVKRDDPSKRLFYTRTNISNKVKATTALDKFLKFIEDEGIKKKNITTTSSGLPIEG